MKPGCLIARGVVLMISGLMIFVAPPATGCAATAGDGAEPGRGATSRPMLAEVNVTEPTMTSKPTSHATTLPSEAISWADMVVQSTASGERRQVLRSPTATLDELEVHISTLNPGKSPHAPHRHPHEEMLMLKEGTLEATINGRVIPLPAGSVLFLAPNDLHGWVNVGTTSATYFVLTWHTPRTGKATP